MCGFVGSISSPGRIGIEPIARATGSLAHRGPDDAGNACISGSEVEVRFGFRRLAILDLSAAGHQPMMDPESGNWIVFNGEIYNFRDIREDLQTNGIHFVSQCDTEVLLKAYRLWGIDCLSRLHGMFAFAIWDAAAQHLVMARDRLGVKPLYYCQRGDHLLFSSEVRALMATGLVEKKINPAALVQYLSFGSVHDPETIVSGVRSLLPGHYAICKVGKLCEKQYWSIPRSRCSNFRPNDAEVRERLHELLSRGATLRMISDVPVGVFLSGGIDSSALVALVSERRREEFYTFAIVFPETAYNEAPYSRAVAQQFGSTHQEVTVSERDALNYTSAALRNMDQPTIDGVNTFVISRAVRSQGFKVALSGIGADEIFAGYSTFETIPAMMRLSKLAGVVPDAVRSAISRTTRPAWNRSDRWRKLQMLLGGNGTLAQAYLTARGLFSASVWQNLLQNRNDEAIEQAFKPLLRTAEEAAGLDRVNQVSYLELRNYVANTLTRDADSMGMANGLEIRQPYLDHKLIEFLFSLPGDYKLKRNSPKWLLTEAVGKELPSSVVRRPKQGFSLPFDNWLRNEMREEVEGVLCSRDATNEFLAPEAIRAVWQDFLRGRTSWSRPWSLYVFRRWVTQQLS